MTDQCARCTGEDIMPKVNGNFFKCVVCGPGLMGSCTNVFHSVHDPEYGCLLVYNSCGTEYQAE